MDVTSRARHPFDNVWLMYYCPITKNRLTSNQPSVMAPLSASGADHEPRRSCAATAPECLQGKGFWWA
jgi:hypothetical protein